ncbi:MAG: hypothetical protein NZT61_03355 [Deltaproteobacteria bacterium]|nr:hypothetical protein [Deltaproteobacteria bacterium]
MNELSRNDVMRVIYIIQGLKAKLNRSDLCRRDQILLSLTALEAMHLFNIERTSPLTTDKVNSKFRQLVKLFHPDRIRDLACFEEYIEAVEGDIELGMILLNKAREILLSECVKPVRIASCNSSNNPETQPTTSTLIQRAISILESTSKLEDLKRFVEFAKNLSKAEILELRYNSDIKNKLYGIGHSILSPMLLRPTMKDRGALLKFGQYIELASETRVFRLSEFFWCYSKFHLLQERLPSLFLTYLQGDREDLLALKKVARSITRISPEFFLMVFTCDKENRFERFLESFTVYTNLERHFAVDASFIEEFVITLKDFNLPDTFLSKALTQLWWTWFFMKLNECFPYVGIKTPDGSVVYQVKIDRFKSLLASLQTEIERVWKIEWRRHFILSGSDRRIEYEWQRIIARLFKFDILPPAETAYVACYLFKFFNNTFGCDELQYTKIRGLIIDGFKNALRESRKTSEEHEKAILEALGVS